MKVEVYRGTCDGPVSKRTYKNVNDPEKIIKRESKRFPFYPEIEEDEEATMYYWEDPYGFFSDIIIYKDN